jgi:hypothetical protein
MGLSYTSIHTAREVGSYKSGADFGEQRAEETNQRKKAYVHESLRSP